MRADSASEYVPMARLQAREFLWVLIICCRAQAMLFLCLLGAFGNCYNQANFAFHNDISY